MNLLNIKFNLLMKEMKYKIIQNVIEIKFIIL